MGSGFNAYLQLKPENSTNYGLGFVFQPTSAVTLTVDAYNIKVRDRIFISKTFVVSAANIVALPELASVGLNGEVQYFTNSLATRTRGVDVVGSYRTHLGAGKLNLTVAYNYNQNKVTQFDPAAIGPNQIVDAENLAPHHRLNTQATWSLGGLRSMPPTIITAVGARNPIIPDNDLDRSSRPILTSATRSMTAIC